MAMYENGTEWPPPEVAEKVELDRENAAWASGDYSEISVFGRYNPGKPGIIDAVKTRIFGTKPSYEQPENGTLVLPENMAGLIASKSARLLFSEPPVVSSSKDKVQERLMTLCGPQFNEMLLEAAESSAIYGGVFLRITWDASEVDQVFITPVNSDMAFPEFGLFGLKSVKFLRIMDTPAGFSDTTVFRLFESHEKDERGIGIITWALYEGTGNNIGEAVPLDIFPELAGLGLIPGTSERRLTSEGFPYVSTETPGLSVVYVKNMPADTTAKGLRSKLGRSDFDRIKNRLAQIDKLNAQWAEEIELGKARLIVPAELLEPAAEGEIPTFDIDKKLFTPTFDQKLFTPGPGGDAVMDQDGNSSTITQVQFSIRTEDYIKALEYFKRSVVIAAGYSPFTFNMSEGTVAVTATEIKAAQIASYETQAEKLKRFHAPLQYIIEKMVAVDAVKFKDQGVAEAEPEISIAFGDALPPDINDVVSQNSGLRSSGSASTETLVRRLLEAEGVVKPDTWINEEVARINAEAVGSTSVAPPTTTPVEP